MFPAKVEASVRQRAAHPLAEKVVVAVKAEKVISKTALAWALTHVIHPGDCITLLALFSGEKTGKRFWNFPRLTGDCAGSQREELPDRICEISEACSQMVLQFHNQIEVGIRIKVVSAASIGAVAAEARSNGANWVVLDKKLKQELKHCIEELRCNILVMKGSQAKVLRLNLGCSNDAQTPYYSAASSPGMDIGKLHLQGRRLKHTTPVGSPEETSTSCSRTNHKGSSLSSDSMKSLFPVCQQNPLFEGPNKGNYNEVDSQNDLNALDSDRELGLVLSSTKPALSVNRNFKSAFWISQNHIVDEKLPRNWNCRKNQITLSPSSRALLDKFVQHDQDMKHDRWRLNQNHQVDHIKSPSIKDVVSFSRTSSMPPPLCSLCQHKAPVFGKPPRQFSYEELQEATDGFSEVNFLAEGGFGNVYRGMLRDGQAVAVKLLKSGGSQADADFCREVRVLSCAQHRNLVLLIGYCIDKKKRILVYEYICNGSLDWHLHGNKRISLDWHSRLKIAIGTARGLRYLHEDCRVGCIVHRDMRPNNILLTHDFEPLVADFGLARWHSEWNISTEERVVGTSGYLAPEYVDRGKITQKVDVYAFGIVLLELITGRRASELHFYKGQHLISDWFHPLNSLEPNQVLENVFQFLDPCLASGQSHDFDHQLLAMVRASSLCLLQDPECRPPMEKVLRILEGGDLVAPLCLDLNSVGSRSGHLGGVSSHTKPEAKRSHSRKLSH